ncbi:LOW QUALITY PROTEIN: scavenger receptor sr-c-like protein [Plakobranchus ocellatus]|uniref:Scavenger receptor sr-c-like protein n=1 Tax=Plakobranchus ocellatus TaxID=259542 RepID=A0AAV4DKN0_9GAST|nr:LOW QUALITY PROTEIN: scavenger receptor sr-c-like protein [Plakobranchus ocellatus]
MYHFSTAFYHGWIAIRDHQPNTCSARRLRLGGSTVGKAKGVVRPPSPGELSSSDEFVDDEDADPDYQQGICEVRRCKEEVWAACDQCLLLMCYDHFLEEVACENHGNMDKIKNRKKKASKAGRCEKEDNAMECSQPAPGEDTTEKEGMQDEDPNMTERHEKVSQEDAVQMPEENVRGRKRHRNEMEWKRTVRKRLRNSEKSYVSSRGKAILAKAMKPPCIESCALKCTQKFSEEERQSIFEDFWRPGDKREQQHFIVRHTEETAVKRKQP